MKRTIHTLCAAALLLAATACEDTLQTEGPAATGDGPTLTLRIDNEEEGAQTRSDLANADPTNNVRSVRILIFQGGTEADNYNDATYVGEETIAEKEWPQKNTRYEYTLKSAFVDGQTYTLLGVGMDNTFEDTYTIDENQTLGQTYARLKANQSPARCEFFTGTVSFTHQGKQTQIDDLHIRRRVAGVMLYVKEIPQRLRPERESVDYRVTQAILRLGRAPRKNVVLRRDFTPDWTEPEGTTDDYLEETEENKALLTLDFTDYEYNSKEEFYATDQPNNTDYQACYMLPLNKKDDTGDYRTFTVELWGVRDDDGTGSLTEGDGTTPKTPELLKTFVVENRTEGNAASFDIRSNYIYCIGRKAQNVDDPISLSGEPLYVQVNEWEEVETGHDFGPARVQAVFDDSENPIHDCMNEEFTIDVLPPLRTIRDRIESIRLVIVHDESYALNDEGEEVLFKDDENLQNELAAEGRSIDYYKNWLYVKDPDVQSEKDAYTTQLTLYQRDGAYDEADEEKLNQLPSVTFFIEDYARFRQWGWTQEGQWKPTNTDIQNINHDKRRCAVYLYTKIDNLTLPRLDTLNIQQYNTISVCYKNPDVELKDEDKALTENGSGIVKCGFSRFDLRDPNISDEFNSYRFQWGWLTTYNYVLYSYTTIEYGVGSKTSGADNVLNIGEITTWETWLDKDHWSDSASQKAQHLFKRVDESGQNVYIMEAVHAPESDN